MFADVISRDDGTPWPPQGMTSARWLDVPVRRVRIADLIATQPGVYLAPLAPYRYGQPVGGDWFAHVIEWRGRQYLEDGHHRALRAALRGHRWLQARVLEVAG